MGNNARSNVGEEFCKDPAPEISLEPGNKKEETVVPSLGLSSRIGFYP